MQVFMHLIRIVFFIGRVWALPGWQQPGGRADWWVRGLTAAWTRACALMRVRTREQVRWERWERWERCIAIGSARER